MANTKLSNLELIIWLAVNTLSTLISFSFFFWVAVNTRLDNYLLPQIFGGLPTNPSDNLYIIIGKCLWNIGLIGVFGLMHSLFAQTFIHKQLKQMFPPQTFRTIFMLVTASCCVLIFINWKHTDHIVIWSLFDTIGMNVHQGRKDLITGIIMLVLMAPTQIVISKFGAGGFLGFAQLFEVHNTRGLKRTEGMPELITNGIFGLVRHPIYFFTLLSFYLSPLMTLDRFIVSIGCSIYLAIGIPYEEKKLVSLFGSSYEAYKLTTPAVVPGLYSIWRPKLIKNKK